MNTKPLTKEKALAYLASYHTPPHVVAHCKMVSSVAGNIGAALNRAGCPLDVLLIESAALVHDMARVSEHHWDVTADLLEEDGFPAAAKIVRVHMHHGFSSVHCPDETDIVCLADRLVLEDQYVGLEKRMDYVIRKAGGSPEVREKINHAKAEIRRFIDHLEERTGIPMDRMALGEDQTHEPIR